MNKCFTIVCSLSGSLITDGNIRSISVAESKVLNQVLINGVPSSKEN